MTNLNRESLLILVLKFSFVTYLIAVTMDAIDNLVKQLRLEPHPEGGFFREVYRSSEELDFEIASTGLKGRRNLSTSIYFLLGSDSFSAFHRIRQDEIWHFYGGSSLSIHMISPDGIYSCAVLGSMSDAANQGSDLLPQFVVPAGFWFAASVNHIQSYSLVGCTVSPGFDYADFELADKDDLLHIYPSLRDVISKYTR